MPRVRICSGVLVFELLRELPDDVAPDAASTAVPAASASETSTVLAAALVLAARRIPRGLPRKGLPPKGLERRLEDGRLALSPLMLMEKLRRLACGEALGERMGREAGCAASLAT